MTKIGPAVQKLFDSTFKLEIPIPGLKMRGFGGITPQIKMFTVGIFIRHILGPNHIFWFIICLGLTFGQDCM
jgi:hypothetical protein